MQFFDRSGVAVPTIFRSAKAQEMRKALAEFMSSPSTQRSQQFPPRQDLPLEEDVLRATSSLFRAKCAFCESKASLGLHRLRPISEAMPLAQSSEAHLYYCWLGTDWGNVYPICPGCRQAAGRLFPVRNDRRGPLPTHELFESFASENTGVWRWPHRDGSLVIDPCASRQQVSKLSFDLSGGLHGQSKASATTIDVFRLDRDDLVAARGEMFEQYAEMILRSGGETKVAYDFRDMEFGGGWYALLRRVVKRTGERLDRNLPDGRQQLRSTIGQVLSTPLGRAAFERALGDVRRPIPRRTRTQVRSSRVDRARKLVAVQFHDFKALEDLTLNVPSAIPPRPDLGRPEGEAAALLVLGENAAGKSSILEGVALALSDPAARRQIGRPADGFVLDPDYMGGDPATGPREATVTLHFEGGETAVLGIANDFTDLERPGGLPRVFAYGAFRQYSDRSSRTPVRAGVKTLFHSDLILRNPEEWLLKLDDVRFALVARSLQTIFGIDAKLEAIEKDEENRRCLIVTEVEPGGTRTRTPFSVASSGFRSVIAMVCDFLQGVMGSGHQPLRPLSEAAPVILIDEIEAHLHPRWKMRIVPALRTLLPSATFIITTHDPLCLRGMHDQEVVVLRRLPKSVGLSVDGRAPTFVQSDVDLPNVENLTVEQLLTSDFFDMFTTDSLEAEQRTAQLASILALRKAGAQLSDEEAKSLRAFEAEVMTSLPLGSTKVQQLVADALGQYLREHRQAAGANRRALEDETKRLIVQALDGYER
ncbi:hypothetical protein SGCZBJ_20400 [Caulobacter zeae]|uniref:AAA+ ATPase domain-containing protein n=1 Tax=Caulobacter zeae TaxID=2055137 RepID=A0A2N5D786_9CAUL|nr:hypothetical protein SGCZBJ_20400 [Caulobacter zeae]